MITVLNKCMTYTVTTKQSFHNQFLTLLPQARACLLTEKETERERRFYGRRVLVLNTFDYVSVDDSDFRSSLCDEDNVLAGDS